MQQLILILYVLVAVCIVVLVLIQHGKGADVGAAFGSGSSNTMFGSAGATPFLVKLTAILAAVFFATAIFLGYLSSKQVRTSKNAIGVSTGAPTQTIPIGTAPAAKKDKANSQTIQKKTQPTDKKAVN